MSNPPSSTVERLVCPQCAGVAMIVEIQDGGSQKIVCAGCDDVVAYSSELVRVTLMAKSK